MAAFTGSTKGAELSKAEYLKRLKIVDDDVDWKQMVDKSDEDLEEEDEEEEAPVVAEVIDDRPEDVKRLEAFRNSNKWRTLGGDGEEDDCEEHEVVSSRGARHDSPEPMARRPVRHDSPEAGALRKVCTDSPDAAPLRRTRHDSPDVSPRRNPGKQKAHSRGDAFSIHHAQLGCDYILYDFNKLVREKPNSSSSQKRSTDSRRSPLVTKARTGTISDSDRSPPRKKTQKGGNADAEQSLPRKKTVKGRHCDSDQSLPRRKSRPGYDSDQSPPRRRAQNGQGSDSDQSPPRRARRSGESDDDLSPPRRKDQSKGMLSGGQAGLVSIDVLRKEQEENRRREKNNQPLEEDSRNAQTVFRDKSGKRRDLDTEREEQKKVDAEKAAKAEKYAQWGKGLAQGQMYQQKIADALLEVQKPMARQRDDEDLDRMLREQERDGDPMAAMLRRKKERTAKLQGVKERPRYKGPPPPPNRFNLQPGYRWDGVDRSSGFEQKRYARMADKSALQEEAYKWSWKVLVAAKQGFIPD
ncbi:hypothetical protein CRUP_002121 [Coryphaenoides rupestris]|nr:hypothetical protein CRUP_002121 [Coryphaenoides rupestris]